MKKLLAGVFLGALFLYLAARNVRLDEVFLQIREIGIGELLAAVFLTTFIQVIRAWRMGIILNPITKMDFGNLFIVSNCGYLGIIALPARMGEILRVYLFARKSEVSLPAIFAAVLLERTLDSMVILLMAGVVLLFLPFPDWLTGPLLVLSCLMAAFLLILLMLKSRWAKLADYLTSLTERRGGPFSRRVLAAIQDFIGGIRILVTKRSLFQAALLSVVIWLSSVLVVYAVARGFNLDVGLAAVVTVVVVLIIGIAIPAAPGFVGNWHWATVVGLGLFGIGETAAFSFAVVHHFLSIAVVILLGLVSFPLIGVNVKELGRQLKTAKGNPEKSPLDQRN
jgi:uncharacterized protein (TIRG00374 family)